MKRKLVCGAILWAFFALFFGGVQAQTARDLTAECALRSPVRKNLTLLRDNKYKTHWASQAGDGARLEITLPEGETCGGIYIQFYSDACAFDVQAQNAQEEWETIAACETTYLTGYAQVPEGYSHLRIVPSGGANRLFIAQLHVFSQGDTPAWVQRWDAPFEKAEMLVLVAHPDDEMLFMGGTIPYYAGERGKAVQVAYLVPSTPFRKLELLDGLWLCGVRNYPDLASFPDLYERSARAMYQQKGWSEARVLRHVTGLLRTYKPDVVVTHDLRGEYGHGAHKVCADALLRCVPQAADASFEPEQAALLGTWEVKKLYLHLYPENVVKMDWRLPLKAFGGKTAFDMAEEGFACHRSQQQTNYTVKDSGKYDNSLFGLAFSTVGDDIEKNDFFENL